MTGNGSIDLYHDGIEAFTMESYADTVRSYREGAQAVDVQFVPEGYSGFHRTVSVCGTRLLDALEPFYEPNPGADYVSMFYPAVRGGHMVLEADAIANRHPQQAIVDEGKRMITRTVMYDRDAFIGMHHHIRRHGNEIVNFVRQGRAASEQLPDSRKIALAASSYAFFFREGLRGVRYDNRVRLALLNDPDNPNCELLMNLIMQSADKPPSEHMYFGMHQYGDDPSEILMYIDLDDALLDPAVNECYSGKLQMPPIVDCQFLVGEDPKTRQRVTTMEQAGRFQTVPGVQEEEHLYRTLRAMKYGTDAVPSLRRVNSSLLAVETRRFRSKERRRLDDGQQKMLFLALVRAEKHEVGNAWTPLISGQQAIEKAASFAGSLGRMDLSKVTDTMIERMGDSWREALTSRAADLFSRAIATQLEELYIAAGNKLVKLSPGQFLKEARSIADEVGMAVGDDEPDNPAFLRPIIERFMRNKVMDRVLSEVDDIGTMSGDAYARAVAAKTEVNGYFDEMELLTNLEYRDVVDAGGRVHATLEQIKRRLPDFDIEFDMSQMQEGWDHMPNVEAKWLAIKKWLDVVLLNAYKYGSGERKSITFMPYLQGRGGVQMLRIRASNIGEASPEEFERLQSNTRQINDRRRTEGVLSSDPHFGHGIGTINVRMICDYQYLSPKDINPDEVSPYCSYRVDEVQRTEDKVYYSYSSEIGLIVSDEAAE